MGAARAIKHVDFEYTDGTQTLTAMQSGNQVTLTVTIAQHQRKLFGPEVDTLRTALAERHLTYEVRSKRGTKVTGGAADDSWLTIHRESGDATVALDHGARLKVRQMLETASDAMAAGARRIVDNSAAYEPHVVELQRVALTSKAETDARLAELHDDD